MTQNQEAPKIHIISRYIPAANRAGHFTYLLDFMRYLHHSGCCLELVALDPLFGDNTIPAEVSAIADIQVRTLPQLDQADTPRPKGMARLKSILRRYYLRLPDSWLYKLRKVYYGLRGREMFESQNWDVVASPAEREFTRTRLKAFQPDVVIANYTFLANIFDDIPPLRPVLKAILTWDIRHQRVHDYKKAGYKSDDADWTWENESELLQKADVLLAIQKDDAEVLKAMAPHSEVVCAPMSARLFPVVGDQVPGRCMFVGSKVDHNVYGIHWFLQHVWPLVLRDMPESSLHICGTVCTEIHETFPNVSLVAHSGPFDFEYSAAEVCLIPLIVGSGLKIKLVEALAHGCACVSTSVGIQGVQEISGQAAFVSDSAEEFAHHVVTLLRESSTRKRLEAQAQRYILEMLSPEKAYQPFVDRIFAHLRRKTVKQPSLTE
jgi:hypothetical protein